jgi:general secretion pathway protein M
MKQARKKRLSRRLLFLTFNALATLFIALFVIMPIFSHFSARNDEISENATQLSKFRSLGEGTRTFIAEAEQRGDPFLPATEERLASADLQANLKAITTAAGARFLGIHSLQIDRTQPLHIVAVSLELEGSLENIRDIVRTIETQTPFLFISSADFQRASDTDESIIRAELKVQGFMVGHGTRATELIPSIDDSRAISPSLTVRDR